VDYTAGQTTQNVKSCNKQHLTAVSTALLSVTPIPTGMHEFSGADGSGIRDIDQVLTFVISAR
jgi:hypothetical protein